MKMTYKKWPREEVMCVYRKGSQINFVPSTYNQKFSYNITYTCNVYVEPYAYNTYT